MEKETEKCIEYQMAINDILKTTLVSQNKRIERLEFLVENLTEDVYDLKEDSSGILPEKRFNL